MLKYNRKIEYRNILHLTGNNGDLLSNSPKMQPIDHISIADV